MHFKWSHRWTIGRGLAGKALQASIDKARSSALIGKVAAKRIYNTLKIPKVRPQTRVPPRHLSHDERVRWIEEQTDDEQQRFHRASDPDPP